MTLSTRQIGALIVATALVLLGILFACGTPVPAAPLPRSTPSVTPAPCPQGGVRCAR